LAKAVERQIRVDLGIHSPSRVTHEVGVFVGRGMHEGMTSQVSKVRAAAGAVAAAATPAMSAGAVPVRVA
jgi:hypothetical protein